MSGPTGVYLKCRIGREWYAIHVAHIVRVLHLVALTELPASDPDVLGMLTLPDRVAPVIDLRRRFGLADVTYRLDTPIIAVDTPHGTVGLVVDEADDIESIDEEQIAPFTGSVSPYIVGVARCSDQLLLLLNTSLLGTEARSAGQILAAEDSSSNGAA